MKPDLTQAPGFLIRDLTQRNTDRIDHYFDDAKAAAIFLWGRDLKRYAVYTRQDDLPANVDKLILVLQDSQGERAG